MQPKYKGLSNIGATCYMNSLLQTLFMTAQFRYAIYKWKYNSKIHPSQSDSIIFQLQKLFAKLQLPIEFPIMITPKQLVKSFQWQDQQTQMQQDIQQFNRLLFQALEKSLSTKSQKYIHKNFIKENFQGELVYYTKCLECQKQSIRQEGFQDIMLTVKNIYEKLAIQRYLKPEILDENNLYDCSNCNKKTKAERGARFIKMPKILNVILQRFNFNYFTMQKQKVNDKVQFPFILNFNNYIHGYNNIPNKLDQDSSKYFKFSVKNQSNYQVKKTTIKKPSLNINGQKKKTTSTTAPSIAGKTTIKPSVNTRSFLADMRKKKNMQEEKEKNQDLFYVNGSGQRIQGDSKQVGKEQVSKMQQKCNNDLNVNKDFQHKHIEQKPQSSNKIVQISQKIQQQIPVSISNLPPAPLLTILPSQPSQPYNFTKTTQPKTIESQLTQKLLQKQKNNLQKSQKLLALQQKNSQLIQKYLQDGPLVYQLYAVLVHNGTANHGHYYSYIKSFQNQKWYCFNDQKVEEINVIEIEKSYGENNSNAYALYYRMYEGKQIKQMNENSNNNQISGQYKCWLKQQIPDYIKQRITEQITLLKQKQKLKLQNLDNLITLKIYYQLHVKQLQFYKSHTLSFVLLKSCQLFKISQKQQNIRLRLFNPINQNKLQTFGGRENLSLEQLKIGNFKSLLLEIKKDKEKFEEYQLGYMNVRICLQEENMKLDSLDEQYLKVNKIMVNKNIKIDQLIKVIAMKRKEILRLQQDKSKQICIIKKHQNNDQSIHQLISILDNYSKTIQDLNILQNQILFIQICKPLLYWPLQFQNQLYKITIKYNNPLGSFQFSPYLTDSRITIQQLKSQLCIYLQSLPQDIIMKLGTKSGRELKDLSLTLKQSRLVNGSQVYFENGIPAKAGEIRVMLYVAKDVENNESFNRLHEFQYVTDVPVNGGCKASEVKEVFVKVMKKVKKVDLNVQQFRIRQKVAEKLGKIYRQRPMREQQLIQKRQISIQLTPSNPLPLDQKQFSIYFRIWDQLNWTLSKKIQLIVNKSTQMRDLINILITNEQNKNILSDIDQVEICRILSINKFNIIDLTAMQWYEMNQDVLVVGQPMFVNSDGLLFIVKNSQHQPRKLTKQEENKFGGCFKPIVRKNVTKSTTYKPKQMKSMKIKVVEKMEEENYEDKHVDNSNNNNDEISKDQIKQNNNQK